MRNNPWGNALLQPVEVAAFLRDILPHTGKVLEIGSWEGASACEILQQRPGLQWLAVENMSGGWGNASHQPQQRDQLLRNVRDVPNFHLFVGSVQELAPFVRADFDVVIVDADHSYQCCLRDLRTAGGLCTRTLIIHDYHSAEEKLAGVKRATNEWMGVNQQWHKHCSVGLSLVLRRA